VQTPTLFILVAREREILAHVPQPYWEIEAEGFLRRIPLFDRVNLAAESF
jgi:DNA topoisomerase IA